MAQEIDLYIDPDNLPSLTLAYLGDSVFERILRTEAIRRFPGNVGEVNRFAKRFSNAQAQAQMAELISEEMTEAEMHVYKRGRNAKSVSAPRTCTISEYRRATGLEALCGYLFLKGQESRAVKLVTLGIDKLSGEH